MPAPGHGVELNHRGYTMFFLKPRKKRPYVLISCMLGKNYHSVVHHFHPSMGNFFAFATMYIGSETMSPYAKQLPLTQTFIVIFFLSLLHLFILLTSVLPLSSIFFSSFFFQILPHFSRCLLNIFPKIIFIFHYIHPCLIITDTSMLLYQAQIQSKISLPVIKENLFNVHCFKLQDSTKRNHLSSQYHIIRTRQPPVYVQYVHTDNIK